MRILITGGGTAGHVTPLLAVASSAKKRFSDSSLYYVGQIGDKMSKDLKNDQLIDKTASIFAGKLRRFHGKKWYWYFTQPMLIFRNIRDIFYLIIGFIQSVFIIAIWKPDVVFVKGGYVGLPVGLAAGLLKKPLVTHDSDVIPGLTNKILARFAKLQAVGMPSDSYPYDRNKIRYTGIPIKSEYSNIKTNKNNTTIPYMVIVGGSLGAVRLNNAILNGLAEILSNTDLNIYWLTGNNQFNEIKNALTNNSYNDRVTVKAFSNNLCDLLSDSDLVVSRAGATTIAELAVLKKPVILVPNPYLTGGHQVKNAQLLFKNKAAIVIDEHKITKDNRVLIEAIIDLANNKDLQNDLRNNIVKFAINDAADNIVDVLIEACD